VGVTGSEADLVQNSAEQPLRCLWLTRFDPRLPDAGDLAYSYHLLVNLDRAGAAITALSMARERDLGRSKTVDGIEWVLVPDDAERRWLPTICRVFSRLPNIAYRCNTKKFQRALDAQLAKKWDVIVIDHLGMGWVWQSVEAYCRRDPRSISVFITHNCEGDMRRAMARNYRGSVFLKTGLHLDALKAGRLEREIVQKSTIFSANTAEDRTAFGNLAKSVVILPGYAGPRIPCRGITAATPRRALIFGSAEWFAKQMNLTEVLSAADEVFRDNRIELWVVGKVAEHLRTGARYRATRFLGFVEDPEPIFRDARIGIVAERTGGGFKHKVLDYVFHRLPIAAIHGSFVGVPLAPNIDYLSFATASELAQGVVAAIDDLDRLNALQEAAYAKCSTAFDWAESSRSLYKAMRDAANRQTGKEGAQPIDPARS
jgi:glycosyltransferase involved in cell wall biosynthesis